MPAADAVRRLGPQGASMRFVRWFSEVGLSDVDLVGGKNASLGEMIRELAPLGIRVPDGFAVTAEAYREFLRAAELERPGHDLLSGLVPEDVSGLVERGGRFRKPTRASDLRDGFAEGAGGASAALSARYQVPAADGAVRSSATAEDLPGASFAGQQDTYLNIRGEQAVLDAIRRCFASLFTARAISYRIDMGFDHLQVALSVAVQRMVRSDLASSGVLFTLD